MGKKKNKSGLVALPCSGLQMLADVLKTHKSSITELAERTEQLLDMYEEQQKEMDQMEEAILTMQRTILTFHPPGAWMTVPTVEMEN